MFSDIASALYQGDPYSLRMTYSYWTPQHGRLQVNNYSTEGTGGSAGPISGYSATLPVGQMNQTQTIELAVGIWSNGNFLPILLNGTHYFVNVSYSLTSGTNQTVSSSSAYANVTGHMAEVPLGVKDPDVALAPHGQLDGQWAARRSRAIHW